MKEDIQIIIEKTNNSANDTLYLQYLFRLFDILFKLDDILLIKCILFKSKNDIIFKIIEMIKLELYSKITQKTNNKIEIKNKDNKLLEKIR